MVKKNFAHAARVAGIAIGLGMMLVTPITSRAATVAYWRFEEGTSGSAAGDILDSSGNGLTGTAVNGPVYNSAVPVTTIPQTGAANSTCLNFNGTSQRIFVPDYAQLALTHSFTIEAYVNIHGQLGAANDIVFRGDDRQSNDPYSFNVIGNTLALEVTNSSNTSASVGAPIAYNTWIHVAGELDDATGKLSLFENGVLVNSITTSIRPFATLDPNSHPGVGIGNVQTPTYNQYFEGSMDEVRISDQALSPSQFLNAPEPSSLLLATLGAIGLTLRRRRIRAIS